MRFKILSLFAALVLVAACSTPAEDTGNNSGSGQSASSNTGSNSGSTSGSSINSPVDGSEEQFIVTAGDRVYFGFDSSALNNDSQATLAKQAAWLLKNPQVTIQVEGHCDERGTREYNLALGERRANAVREYLISLGVSDNRISTISYGKERPEVEGSNEEAWAQNRRGVTRLVSGAAS